MSCVGLDPKQGVAEGFEEQALFKEILLQMAEQTVLLVDSSKLSQRSEYFFANLGQLSQIITDASADPIAVRQLIAAGCAVTIAE